MRRGDLYWVEFEPVRGAEASKTRPAVVVSNDAANRSIERGGRGVVTVVPVTSNVSKVYPFQVFLPAGLGGLKVDSKAQAEQVRAVAIARVGHRIGELPDGIIVKINDALRLHLDLS